MLATAGTGTEELISGLLSTIQPILQYLGTIAFALSGALAAGRRSMDIGGVVVLGAIVAVGGGTMRDVLLDRTVFWVDDPAFLVVGVITALLVLPVLRLAGPRLKRAYWLVEVFDAVGLALFVVIGTNIALAAGANPFAAATIGLASGIGGGVLRDVLAAEIPTVLRDGRLYMTAALAGAGTYIVLLEMDLPPVTVLWVPIVIILALRFVSLRYRVEVPRFILNPEHDPNGPP